MASDDDGLSGNELSADVAHISSPVNGKVETRSIFAVKGGVLAPVFVQVRKRNADGTELLLATAYPFPTVGGPWSISVVLGEGTHTIIAVAIGVDGQEFPSKPVTFSVRLALPAPQINKPEQGSTQDVNTWVSGTGGDYSANVKILEDLTHRELGSSPVALTGAGGVYISCRAHVRLLPDSLLMAGRVLLALCVFSRFALPGWPVLPSRNKTTKARNFRVRATTAPPWC